MTQVFKLGNIHCGSCVRHIENGLAHYADIKQATVNFGEKTLSVDTSCSAETIIQRLESLGYEASVDDATSTQHQQDAHWPLFYKTLVSGLIGLPLMISNHIVSFLPTYTSSIGYWFWLFIGGITLAGMWYAGGTMYRNAWVSIQKGHTNMNTLITLGTGAAWFYSMVIILFHHWLPTIGHGLYFETALLILAFINLGHFLEARTKGQTSAAIQKLIGLQPKTATYLDESNQPQTIEIDQIVPEMILRVRPGEKIAVDGQVINGNGQIDESMLTGEPMPCNKQQDDLVWAGTMNQQGTLTYRVTQTGQKTKLAQIIHQVQQAQNSKPAISRLADQIAAYFVPIVLGIALVTGIVWFFADSWAYSFMTAVTVLVIACPCALGLATPLSIMSGVGQSARHGLLIRNGQALQTLGKITTIAFDKTGTLTQGRPEVTHTIDLNDKLDQQSLLYYAASLEQSSNHPLATAILNANLSDAPLLEVTDFHNDSGRGVMGQLDGQWWYLGNQSLMQQQSIDLTSSILQQANELSSQGITPIYLAQSDHIVGMIGIQDPIKPHAKQTVDTLHRKGLKLLMLTGDQSNVAQHIAAQLGIDDVMAQQLPEDKQQTIAAYQAKKHRIAMVGDGINDAPALAQADVGIAMGQGSDIAMESGDVVLMNSQLATIGQGISIANATMRNIKQNLFGAFCYNTTAIPIAAGVLYPLTGWLLHPMIAGAAMAASSLTVVLNASRLRIQKF